MIHRLSLGSTFASFFRLSLWSFIAFKNKAKNVDNFYFYSIDENFSLDDVVEGKNDNDFHIEGPNFEEGFLGCKWPKLPFKLDDLKIFSREVEVTYTEVLT